MKASMDSYVAQLVSLASALRQSRTKVESGIYTFDTLPEEPPEYRHAFNNIRLFGEMLYATDKSLMMEVYDEAVERHGYHAVQGVSGAWDGVGGWAH